LPVVIDPLEPQTKSLASSFDALEDMDMIAAIYARKSTDQTVVVDESKSVTRQIEQARLYAVKKG
jgi:hypothetical protein